MMPSHLTSNKGISSSLCLALTSLPKKNTLVPHKATVSCGLITTPAIQTAHESSQTIYTEVHIYALLNVYLSLELNMAPVMVTLAIHKQESWPCCYQEQTYIHQI